MCSDNDNDQDDVSTVSSVVAAGTREREKLSPVSDVAGWVGGYDGALLQKRSVCGAVSTRQHIFYC